MSASSIHKHSTDKQKWFPTWAIDFTKHHSAILVTPNYRLMPEARGMDIISDTRSFYAWLATEFPSYLEGIAPGMSVDFEKVLNYGESAGGYLAVHSALSLPLEKEEEKMKIKAVIATYPYFLQQPRPKAIFGMPDVPREVLDGYVKALKGDEIVSAAIPPKRMDLGFSISQQQRKNEFFGEEDELNMMALVGKWEANGVEGPKILILHGRGDSAVPVEGSRVWVGKVKEVFGEDGAGERVRLVERKGEHGFDGEAKLGDEWLVDALEWVVGAWLKE